MDIHGRATIRVNGQVIETENDASLKVGGVKNNGRMVGKTYCRSQTDIMSEVKCKVPCGSETELTEMQGWSGVEVQFHSDMGKVYVINGASQNAELELVGGDDGGLVELTFNGPPAEEMSI